jgi:hypothetical protein
MKKLQFTALAAFVLGACTMPNPAFDPAKSPPVLGGSDADASPSDGGVGSSINDAFGTDDAAAPGVVPSNPDDGGVPSSSVDGGLAGGLAKVASNYFDLVSNTPGLVSYWRMGGVPNLADDFAGTPGTALQSRPVSGYAWTLFTAEGGGSQNAVFTNAGRLRKGGTGNRSHYYSSHVPSSPDYAVEADIHVKSVIDDISLIGRQNLASNNGMDWYSARFFNGGWELRRVINDAGVNLASASTPTLTNDTTYRLRLEMSGSNPVVVRVFLDGTLIMSASDTNANRITVTGRPGLRFGALSSTDAVTDNTGLHLDNLRVVPIGGGVLPDSKGTNNGMYRGAPALNVLGALVGDSNAATRFNASGDYAAVAHSPSLDLGDGPFTLEAWVKRNDSAGSVQTIMHKGMNAYQFGFHNNRVGLFRFDGSGRGEPLALSTTSQTGVTGYRHYVATKNGAAVSLYVDGVDVTGTVTNQTLSNSTADLVLGGSPTGEFLNGDLDEVAIYKAVLDAATVNDHYRIGSGR